MNRFILPLTLLFFSTFGFAQVDSIRGNQFELKGKMINDILFPARCGDVAFAIVIEFEIIEFSDSNYSLDSVPVIFTCPEFYGDDFFELGEVYIVKLADEVQADLGWAIPNASVLLKYNLDKELFAIGAEKVDK